MNVYFFYFERKSIFNLTDIWDFYISLLQSGIPTIQCMPLIQHK